MSSRELDLKYLVGADGLSLLMILLTALVTLAAIWTSPRVERMPGHSTPACFSSPPARSARLRRSICFSSYAFHELALIPTFLLIGIWGNRKPAGRRVENHHLPRARQFCSAHRTDRPLPVRARGRTRLSTSARSRRSPTAANSPARTQTRSISSCSSASAFSSRSSRFTPGRRKLTPPRPRPRRCCTPAC